MKNLSNMVLRYYIGLENSEARFSQLVDFLNSTGVHRVSLFTSSFAEDSSIIPLSYYKQHSEMLKPYVAKLRDMGVEVGINVLNTVGHAYYADENEFGFKRAVTINGEESRGCVCIRDKGIIDFVKEEYKLYAALKPSVIFTDDDIRAISLGQIICLCEEHVKLISERVGKTLCREEIENAILDDSLDTNEIKEAYFEQIKEDIEYEMLLNFNTMKSQIGNIEEIRATGGGATSDVWLQIKADILNTEITALNCKEVGCAGTSILAGKSIGAFSDIKDSASKMAPTRKIFKPNPQNTKIYAEYYGKYKNLYNAVKNL